MQRRVLPLVMVLCLLPWSAQAVTAYPYGTLPTGASDTDVTNAYSLWKTRHLVTVACGQRVDNGGGTTVSEGMGYGMLMSAYLETTDTQLNNLYTFYIANLDSHGLMNWTVPGSNCGNNNQNAATDGDLDACLALVKAAKKWPASANNWGSRATSLLNSLYSKEVDSCSGLANGDAWGGCTNGSPKNYNPSYFRTGYLKSFDCFEGGSRWTAVRNQSYTVLGTTISSYKLPPDWVTASGAYGSSDAAGGYGYDSCRTPWAVGMDYLWWGNTTAQSLDNNVTASFWSAGNGAGAGATACSAAIGDDYNYSTGAKDSNNHEPEFIGAVGVASMVGANAAFRNALYADLVATDKNTYFSDSLKVVYLMALTGNFQEPCNGGGSPGTATPTPTVSPTPTRTPTPTPAFSLAKSASLSTAAVGQTFTYYLSYANLSSGPDSSGVTSGVSLQFHDNSQGATGSTMPTNFQISNASGASINLANYRIRYFYYDAANTTPASYVWNNYYDQAGSSSASFLAYGPYTGPPSADLELRISFSGGTVANGATDQLQGAFNYAGNPSLTFSDDWSYPGAVGSFSSAAAANIVLEQDVAGTWKPVTGAYPGGAASISTVSITDTFDPRLTFVSASPAGTYAGGLLTVNFASLAPAQAGNVTVVATVNGTASPGNVIPNQATIGAPGFPSVTSAVCNVTVGAAATPTPTPTRTPSSTPTRSATASPTRTATTTVSASATVSPSPTATASATATVTASRTSTPSASASPSGSPSPSASMTATATATRSPSASSTASPSASPTRTASASPTVTPSASPTATPTPSFSVSPTDTPYAGSPTDTFTITATPTASPTPSASRTASPSATPSSSPTVSRTASPTVTPSASPTVTPTATASASASASASATASPSVSPSFSATPTATGSMTPTLTATVSSTVTASPSPSASFTASPAWTPTVGPTVSSTATATPTITATASPSRTLTPTGTSAATALPTVLPSETATLAASPPSGPLQIGRHAPVPSPWRGGPARLAVELLGPCESLTLRLYTPAMACVGEAEWGPQSKGWGQVDLPVALMAGLPSGVYYYSLQARRAAARSTRVLGAWMVLR